MLTLKIISLFITIYCSLTEIVRFKTVKKVNQAAILLITAGAVSFITLQWLI